MVDIIDVNPKTPHNWRSSQCGYDPSDYCTHCGANSYEAYGTKFCEDYKQAKLEAEQKKTRTHPPTEAAFARARTVLTAEEWSLLGLDQYPISREYRPRDFIRV
jgi:hypothetical protein